MDRRGPRGGASAHVVVIMLLSACLLSSVAAAQTRPVAKAPVGRTAWGDPEIGGQWLNDDPKVRPMFGGVDIVNGSPATDDALHERPRRELPRSLVLGTRDGDVPYQPWAKAKRDARQAKYGDRSSDEFVPTSLRCTSYGVVGSMLRMDVRLYQFPTHILMLWEYPQFHRIIWTDGRPPLDPGVKLWQGQSTGRWDGDTLTVTTTNMNALAWFDYVGNFATDNVRTVETFKIIDRRNIEYRLRVEDPAAYTQPWQMAFRLRQHLDGKVRPLTATGSDDKAVPKETDAEILEVACVEGRRTFATDAPGAGS